MSNIYKYLFPFEAIPRGASVIIYGAGEIGQEYLKQIKMTGYCNPVCFIDRRFKECPPLPLPVTSVENINEYYFDYVVLALKVRKYVASIMDSLREQGVKDEQIVFVGVRPEWQVNEGSLICETAKSNDEKCAFYKTELSVAINLRGGLGDMIQRKPLVKEIARNLPGCRIDIYAVNTAFAYSVYGDIPELNEIIEDIAGIYQRRQNQYLLALEVSFLINIDICHIENLTNNKAREIEWLGLLLKECQEYDLPIYPIWNTYIHSERMMRLGLNVYEQYNYTKAIKICDWHTSIPMLRKGEEGFVRLGLPEKYITIHTGSSVVRKGKKILDARQWPLDYYKQFCRLFKDKYLDVAVVQIGDDCLEKISYADFYVWNENLEIIKYVLKESTLHLSSEGGLMHLASQIGTKCLTFFGPTPMQLYGYPNNINISADNCKYCYRLYADSLVCARHLEKPECMYGISPELVMEKIEEYMDM